MGNVYYKQQQQKDYTSNLEQSEILKHGEYGQEAADFQRNSWIFFPLLATFVQGWNRGEKIR